MIFKGSVFSPLKLFRTAITERRRDNPPDRPYDKNNFNAKSQALNHYFCLKVDLIIVTKLFFLKKINMPKVISSL